MLHALRSTLSHVSRRAPASFCRGALTRSALSSPSCFSSPISSSSSSFTLSRSRISPIPSMCPPSLFSPCSRSIHSSSSASLAQPEQEIKIMSYYVSPSSSSAALPTTLDAFSQIHVPLHLASRSWRFNSPHSVIIPLTDMTNMATHHMTTTLADLLLLPPVNIAPIVHVPASSSAPLSGAHSVLNGDESSLEFDSTQPFMVAFQYGAIVFFNVNENVQQMFLPQSIQRETAKLQDDYKILISHSSSSSFSARFHHDCVSVSQFDLNAVRIAAQIIAQATAMMYYEKEAERMLLKLRQMLKPSGGKFRPRLSSAHASTIISYVADSSTAMVEVLTELKVLDRSEIVWGRAEYEGFWKGLRREFDIPSRFDILQTKLDLLRDSHPFFLSVIHQLQTHRMEVIIILLIFIEVVLSVAFHSPLIPWLRGTLDEDTIAPEQSTHKQQRNSQH